MRLFTSLVLLASILSPVANGEEYISKSNRIDNLHNNPKISTYAENNRHIPIYVEGELSGDKVISGDELNAVIRFLEANKGTYKIGRPSEDFVLERVDYDKLGMSHVRIRQVYNGVAVEGGELIAHITSTGDLKTVNGRYFHDIDLNAVPVLSQTDAVSIADNDLKSFSGTGLPTEPKLIIFPWENDYYLCWKLAFKSNTPPANWEYYVDAETGDIVFRADLVIAFEAIGTGFGTMEFRDHIDTYYSGGTYELVDYSRMSGNNPHGHNGQMSGMIKTHFWDGLPGIIANDFDNYWDDSLNQRAAVDAHVYSCLAYDYFLSHLGRNSFDDNGSNMNITVNYDGSEDNAYWNGSQIYFTIWTDGRRSLAACPDVIAHEWGHGITSNTSGLYYRKESGALNESFSDMLGAAFEWAHPSYDTPDWDVSENGSISGYGFRSMSDPHMLGDPDFYGNSDMYWVDVENCSPNSDNDWCGVHTNSGVGNKWYQLLSDGGTHHSVTVTGIGSQNAILIAYRANQYYWTSQIKYYDAALATISAANDLDITGAWALEVENAWKAVGVIYVARPSLAIDFPDGVPYAVTPTLDYTFAVDITSVEGGSLTGTPQIHYSVDGGPYTSDVLVQISAIEFEATLPAISCGSKYEFYISAQETSTGTVYNPDPASPHPAVCQYVLSYPIDDDFETDLGWTVYGDAVDGMWERGEPAGGGDRGDPPTDFDGSGKCYLTDNVYGNSDVDDGYTYLQSPVFDLTGSDAYIHYARWYSNNIGNNPLANEMKVYISNDAGYSTTLVETVGPIDQAMGGWYTNSFLASDFITPSDQMMIVFRASDLDPGAVVEAGIDEVKVLEVSCAGPAPLSILSISISDRTAGAPVSVRLKSVGGGGNIVWSDKYNDLDGTGLSLSSTGLLSGIPTGPDTISFTARIIDGFSNIDEKLFSFNVNPELIITTTSLPDWTMYQYYQQLLECTGGTGTKTWKDKDDVLSYYWNLTLHPSGLLSDSPYSNGTVVFTAQVTDEAGAVAEQMYVFTINPRVRILTYSLPEGAPYEPYSVQLEAQYGTPPLVWSDAYNQLDTTGLTLSPDGLLSGLETEEKTIIFTAKITDVTGNWDQQWYNFRFVRNYTCGDANGDEIVNVGDAVQLINYVFKNGPAPNPLLSGDSDCDGVVNVGDAVWVINYVFKSGPAPCVCP